MDTPVTQQAPTRDPHRLTGTILGVVVRSFAVPMVFGIVIAAISSVFIAAPILLFLGIGAGDTGSVIR